MEFLCPLLSVISVAVQFGVGLNRLPTLKTDFVVTRLNVLSGAL